MNEPQPAVANEATLEELRSSVEGDRGFVVELIEAFLSDGAAHVAEVEAALSAGDATALVRPAHTLKSSSATVGADRLAGLARELELAGRSGAIDARTAVRAGELRSAWEEAAGALRAWVADGDDR